jgi:shikimate kinase
LSVYICWSVSELAKRLVKNTRNRPVLGNMSPEMLGERIRQHLAEREPFYRKADLIVHPSGKSQDECAGEILAAVNSLQLKTPL